MGVTSNAILVLNKAALKAIKLEESSLIDFLNQAEERDHDDENYLYSFTYAKVYIDVDQNEFSKIIKIAGPKRFNLHRMVTDGVLEYGAKHEVFGELEHNWDIDFEVSVTNSFF